MSEGGRKKERERGREREREERGSKKKEKEERFFSFSFLSFSLLKTLGRHCGSSERTRICAGSSPFFLFFRLLESVDGME